ncbi:hypothetical protein K6112_00470 [Methylophilales bacterium]|nr:hypothetical protein K6112_00470 [Methylophilales bacterium]
MSKILLVCFLSPDIGIGHLSRLLVLADSLKKDRSIVSEFLIFGDLIKKNELATYNVHNFSLKKNFGSIIENILDSNSFDALVFDLYPKHNINNLGKLFYKLKQLNICIISIDSLIEYCNIIDLIWVPSFNFDCDKHSDCTCEFKSGWDSFLIKKRLQHKVWRPGSKVLILTGGSDAANLVETLPAKLDRLLANNIEIHWVKGPFSRTPKLPKKCRLNWIIHDSPEHLDALIVKSNYVMTVFGISFFEVLQYGVPTVVFSPYGMKDNDELNSLFEENVAMVTKTTEQAIEGLINLMKNDKIAKKYSINALKKMSINGTSQLSKKIISLIGPK